MGAGTITEYLTSRMKNGDETTRRRSSPAGQLGARRFKQMMDEQEEVVGGAAAGKYYCAVSHKDVLVNCKPRKTFSRNKKFKVHKLSTLEGHYVSVCIVCGYPACFK